MRVQGRLRRAFAVIVAGAGLVAAGCVHGGHHGQPVILPPPPGTVPSELSKQMLPEYVIEPPDVLRITAIIRTPLYEDEAAAEDKKVPKRDPVTKKIIYGVAQDKLRFTPLYAVNDVYTVRPDGTVYLGVYGSLPVAGLTVSAAAESVRAALAQRVAPEAGGTEPDAFAIVLDVVQYQSKRIYVFLDGGGQGEQIIPLPVTGSETVLDALATVGGLPPVASKRNVWVARRTPHAGQPEQILPVDYVGISQHGITTTNYQLMPGDRVYVKAQRLVTIDNTLARVLAPIDKIFGVTLLGTSTVNQINGRGNGFGGGF